MRRMIIAFAAVVLAATSAGADGVPRLGAIGELGIRQPGNHFSPNSGPFLGFDWFLFQEQLALGPELDLIFGDQSRLEMRLNLSLHVPSWGNGHSLAAALGASFRLDPGGAPAPIVGLAYLYESVWGIRVDVRPFGGVPRVSAALVFDALAGLILLVRGGMSVN